MIYLLVTRKSQDYYLDIHLKQMKMFCPYVEYIICTDDAEHVKTKYGLQNVIEYDKPCGKYFKNLSTILPKIDHEYIIFVNEVRMLRAPVKPGTFEYLIEGMKERNIDGLYLRTCGVSNETFDANNIFRPFKGIGFAAAPAIWKRDVLIDITNKFKDHSYECSECEMINSYISSTYNIYSIAHPDDKKAKFLPEQAYNSSIVPFIYISKRGCLADCGDVDSNVDFFTEFNIQPPANIPFAKTDADTVTAEFIINYNKNADEHGQPHQCLFYWHPKYPFILKDGTYQIDKNLV